MMGIKIIGLLCIQLITSIESRSLEDLESKIDVNPSSEKKAFTIDDVITGVFNSDGFNGTWISETEIFYRIDELLLKFDVTARQSEIIAKHNVFHEASNLKFYLSPDNNYVLIRNVSETIYRHSSLSRYIIYSIKDRSLAALADGQELSTAAWAPLGSSLIYVLNNDIYYHQISPDGVETRRITFDGRHQEIYNGIPDWVYEEEVLATDRAFWISPNGEYLAFATFNDTKVPKATIQRYGKPGDLNDQYPKEEIFRYPKSGATNPDITLNLIDLTDHGSSLINLRAPVNVVGSEPILFAVRWFDKNTLVATWTNRIQNNAQIGSYSLTGQWQPLTTISCEDGWLLNTNSAPIYHKSYMLTIKQQPVANRTLGTFSHVTRYRLLNGILDHEEDLTPGNYWVRKIYGVNDVKRVVYFTAAPPNQPSQNHLYQVGIDVTDTAKPVVKCMSCEVKTPEGNNCKYVNSVSFSTDYSRYVLSCSSPTEPPVTKVFDLEGSELYTWSANKQLRAILAKKILPKYKDLEVEAGGFNAQVRLLLPDDFDQAKKYPLLVNVYAGPDSQRINDGYSIGLESYMSTNRSIIYAWIDGRGSSSKGTAMMMAVYRNLGSAEIEDQITVTRKLQEMYPWIDSNRTAIWGWSYGGYSTAMTLTKDEDNLFKCGISVAPVTNWIYYDSIYTERFMDEPKCNLNNYESSSVLNRVTKLRNKKYMLIHGTGDDNVHYQQSMMLAKALAEKDILFDQVSYPDEAHHLKHVTRHLYHTMDKFWSECFGYDRSH